ncbi:MAG: histidine phosphatase family protein [Gammaproteobacteria bacterium]|nr:histidine phosphatase family protein [Gammaproteobacteria bacterium]MBV8405269.1 histidine phosphatase family protein [Gammaproteobacteria bacterium]
MTRLILVRHGHVEGMSPERFRGHRDVPLSSLGAAPQLVRLPHGESVQDLVARMANVLRLVRERHAQDTVVVVGHSAGNRALLLQTLEQPLSAFWRLAQDPCSVSDIELEPRVATLRRFNEIYY